MTLTQEDVVGRDEVGSGSGRLGEIERRIDRAVERSASARDDTRARVDLRLGGLRDRANRGASLDALQADVSVVEAQLDLEDASGTEAFIQAARRVLRAYRTRLDVLSSDAGGSSIPSPEVGTAERLITVANERLDRFERATAPSGPSRTRVIVALDDLDRSCRAAVEAGWE